MIPEITITTPALLFPAISLLMVAYTNRFNVLGTLVRSMSATYRTTHNEALLAQMRNLRKRLHIIRNMQGFGVGSIFMCVVCIFVLFAGELFLGKILFGISLILMLFSLTYSLMEVLMSVQALNMELREIEESSNK